MVKAKAKTTRVTKRPKKVRFQSVAEISSSAASSASATPPAESKSAATLRTPAPKQVNEPASDDSVENETPHEDTLKKKGEAPATATTRRGSRALLVTPIANVGAASGVPVPKTPTRRGKRTSVGGVVIRSDKKGSIKRRISGTGAVGGKKGKNVKSKVEEKDEEVSDVEDDFEVESDVEEMASFLKRPKEVQSEDADDVSEDTDADTAEDSWEEAGTPSRASRASQNLTIEKVLSTSKPVVRCGTTGRYEKKAKQVQNTNIPQAPSDSGKNVKPKATTTTNTTSTTSTTTTTTTNGNRISLPRKAKNHTTTNPSPAPPSSAPPSSAPKRTRKLAKTTLAKLNNLKSKDMSEDSAMTGNTHITARTPKRQSATIAAVTPRAATPAAVTPAVVTPGAAPTSSPITSALALPEIVMPTTSTIVTRKRSAAAASILAETTRSIKKLTPAVPPVTTQTNQVKTKVTAPKRKTYGCGRKTMTVARGKGGNTDGEVEQEESGEDVIENARGAAVNAQHRPAWLSCLCIEVDKSFPRDEYLKFNDEEL